MLPQQTKFCQNCSKPAIDFDGLYWYCSKSCLEIHRAALEEFNEKMSNGVFSPADEDQANSRLTRITDKKGTK